MKKVGVILSHIIYGLVMIFILNSCTVVKTPYFKTGYYQKTLISLESLKSKARLTNDSIFAGFSKKSITPEIKNPFENKKSAKKSKVPIAGYGQLKSKFAEGIHDSIFVKAVALKAGQAMIVIISADLLIMPPNIIDAVAALLEEKGLQRSQLFFSATHTHSSIGGWGYGVLGKLIAGKENSDLEELLIKQIKEVVLNAISDLHPARLGTGSFNGSEYIRNRLTGDPRQNNNDFTYIVIKQLSGKTAIIGSFSAHATTLGRKNTLISGDYPGYWERKVEDSTANIAIFCGGSMASQSPVGQGSEFESAKYIGEALADSMSAHLKLTNLNERLIISSLSLKMHLPEYHFRLAKNINLTTGLSERLMPYPENVYLQALRINNLIWFLTPGDFSAESALLIRERFAGKGYDATVSGYNGSYVGYILPGKYFYLDNYESLSMGWFGPTMGDYTFELMEQMGDILILNIKYTLLKLQ